MSPLFLTKNIKTYKSNINISHSTLSQLLLTKNIKTYKSNIYNSHSTHTFMNADTQFMLKTL